MSETVYLFSPWLAHPKYHDYGRIRERDGESADVTRCGLVMYDGAIRYSAILLRWQADLFAEPCVKCYPRVGRESETR